MLTLEARKSWRGGEKFGLVGKATSRRIERRMYVEVGAGEVGQGKVGLAGVCIEGDEERHISTRLRTSGSRGRGSRSPAMYHACLRRRPTSASAPPRVPSSSAPQIPEIEQSSTLLVNEDPRIDRTPFFHDILLSPKKRGRIQSKTKERRKSGFNGTMKMREREYNGIVTLIELFPSVRTTQNVEQNVLEARDRSMAAQSTPLDSTGNDATSSSECISALNEKNGRPPNGLLFDEAARKVVSPRSLCSTLRRNDYLKKKEGRRIVEFRSNWSV